MNVANILLEEAQSMSGGSLTVNERERI